MAAKVEEAVRTRRSADFLIIARTSAAREKDGLAEAIRSGEPMRKAGADILLVLSGKPAEARTIGEALPGLKMFKMAAAYCPTAG
jgi:2-methylisocitrate lyase-like PEP mutase family enzyme